MKALRHIGIGFLVSFVGSLPLGYLNVIGLDVYTSGIGRLIWYLLGVITIEVVAVYLTLIFAERLVRRKRLLRLIAGFSVIFMFVLALVFYAQGKHGQEPVHASVDYAATYRPYLLGIALSCFNFLQLPFWVGWNLYLLNKNHITPGRTNEFSYVFGTATGTFCGMLAFIIGVAKLDSAFFSGDLMQIIAVAFVVVGIVQAWKYYAKYLRKRRLES